MATARSKIVRVEEVPSSGKSEVGTLFNSPLLSSDIDPTQDESIEKGSKHDNDSRNSTYSEENMLDDAEAEDILPPLPENWPKIPTLFVRRHWDFSMATQPAVEKATYHLELLQNLVEDWFTGRLSQLSRESLSNSALSAGRQSKPLSAISRVDSAFSNKSTDAESSGLTTYSTPSLVVEGLGVKNRVDSAVQSAYSAITAVPYLGAEEVIEEVITLIARFISNRNQTKTDIVNEKERVVMLQSKIDELAENRLMNLADHVQKEHEKCAMDINELNWHVSYRTRSQNKMQNKVDMARKLNKQLKEDIQYVHNQVPLIEEKLKLENGTMEKLKHAQSETIGELGTTVERCAKVENKSEDAQNKAEMERKQINKDLDGVRHELQVICNELEEANITNASYIQQCNEYYQQLDDNKKEFKALEVGHENIRSSEAAQAEKVKLIDEKIIQEEAEYKRLEDINIVRNRKYKILVKENRAKEDEIVKSNEQLSEELRLLKRENDHFHIKIEDHESKIKECIKQKTANGKNLERIKRETERTKIQAQQTDEELTKARIINDTIKKKLQRLERTLLTEEEKLKVIVEELRKQVKEEIHSKSVLRARIHAENTERATNFQDYEVKKEKARKLAEEVTEAVLNIERVVEDLREKHVMKSKIVAGLKLELDEIASELQVCTEDTEKLKQEIAAPFPKLKDAIAGYESKLSEMSWKTKMMNTDLEDKLAHIRVMERNQTKVLVECDQLKDQLNELTITINTTMHAINELKGTFDQSMGRFEDMRTKHRDLMRERKKALQNLESDLEKNLLLNKELASQYRKLSMDYLWDKQQLLGLLSQRIKLEESLKDLNQVQALQTRMHAALVAYFKLRNKYGSAELARIQNESNESSKRVGQLQVSMDEALSKISDFLRNEMTGAATHREAMKKAALDCNEPKTASLPPIDAK